MHLNFISLLLLSPFVRHRAAAREPQGASPPPSLPDTHPARRRRGGKEDQRDISEYTRAYIDYSIYFRSFDEILFGDDICTREAHGKGRNISNEGLGATYYIVSGTEGRCANPIYRPRWVDSTQVTWRHVQHEDRDRGREESRGDEDEGPVPAWPGSQEPSNEEGKPQKDKPRDRATRRSSDGASSVHPLFAIALLLPQHPPSADMYSAVRAIAPMFPSVQFVVGDAVEFQDLPLFSEFPQLLLFSEGTMSGRFAGRPASLADLGAAVAAWAKEPPRAVPAYYFAPELSNLMTRSLSFHQDDIPFISYFSKFLRWSVGAPLIQCANHFGCAPPAMWSHLEALDPLLVATLLRRRPWPAASWPLEPALPWALAADSGLRRLLALPPSLPALSIIHVIAIVYSLVRLTFYVK